MFMNCMYGIWLMTMTLRTGSKFNFEAYVASVHCYLGNDFSCIAV